MLCFSGYTSSDINELYKIQNQKKTFQQLLNSDKWINQNKGLFLTRGHVVARSFFKLKYQLNLTFNFVNICPQWDSINGGNMQRVEQVI